MYLTRERIFEYDCNKYYKPKGTFNTWSSSVDAAMPNCTMYCFLRMHEASDQLKKQNTWIRSCGGFGKAKTWYETTTLPKGSELREGAIAVFDGNSGHVLFVERKIDATHAIISESNYDQNKNLRNWKFWRYKEVELKVGKSTISGVGKLLGFIYVPINDKRVSRSTKKDQVEVCQALVNVRKEPSVYGDIFCKGLYCPVGIFDVLEWEEADGYTWAKLDTDCWIACGSSWSKIYKKESLNKKELTAKLNELNLKRDSLNAQLKEVNAQIKEIEAKLK